jgi:uncharacterized protein involved in exopolysaccharide biosynthesis
VFDLDDDIQEGNRPEPGRGGARYGRAVELGRLVRALLRRRYLIITCAVLGVVGGAVIAKTLVPRTYVTETVMVWEAREGEGADPDVRQLRTLVDSVKLPTNLATVRQDLAIPQSLDRLAARLEVHFDQNSNLVVVRAEGESGEEAVALCESVVEVFLDHQRNIARERLDETVVTLEDDEDRARDRLEVAQAGYDEFRAAHGVSDLSVERQNAIELAASLRAQADIARADGEALEARGETVSTHMAQASESATLREARQRLDSARARLSEDHPRVQALAAEVAVIRESEPPPNAGSGREANAARNRAAARRRQEAYQRMEETARQRLDALSSVEGEASALLASVRVAEGHLADVEADLARARDGARDVSPGFRVVAAPLMPEAPERSYRKPAAIAIPIAVLLLVLLVILAVELRGLRVKTANELAYWGRAPVVASTTWPSQTRELAAIVDELAEEAAKAGGCTLVISADDIDRHSAEDIADHLRVAVTVKSGGEAVDTTFYDPGGSPLVTEAPDHGRGLLTSGAPGSDIVIDEDGKMVEDDPRAETGKRRQVPSLARSEHKSISRRRGRRVERVQVSKDQIYLESEEKPVEIVTADADTGDAFVRRGARAADRVLVIVRSGALSVTKASELRSLVGRQDDGVGFLLVGVPDWLAVLADQAGPVASFWRARRDD